MKKEKLNKQEAQTVVNNFRTVIQDFRNSIREASENYKSSYTNARKFKNFSTAKFRDYTGIGEDLMKILDEWIANYGEEITAAVLEEARHSIDFSDASLWYEANPNNAELIQHQMDALNHFIDAMEHFYEELSDELVSEQLDEMDEEEEAPAPAPAPAPAEEPAPKKPRKKPENVYKPRPKRKKQEKKPTKPPKKKEKTERQKQLAKEYRKTRQALTRRLKRLSAKGVNISVTTPAHERGKAYRKSEINALMREINKLNKAKEKGTLKSQIGFKI